MLNKDTDREHLAVETNAAGVETFALPDPEAIEESSIDALPHSQPKISPAYDASTMVRVGESGNIQNAAQEAGFTIGDTPDGLTEAEREEKKKKDEEFHETLSGALEEQKERQERERQEAHAKEWDKAMHDFGGQQMSGTRINAIYDWFSKKENEDKIRKQLAEQGKSQKEIDEAIRQFKESQKIWEKMRLGTATEEEKKRYEQIMQNPAVQDAITASAKGQEADATLSANREDNSAQKNRISEFDELTEDIALLEKERIGTLTAERTNQSQDSLGDPKFQKGPIQENPPGYSDFPSAAALKVQENFQAAANGNEPPTHAAPSHKPLTTASLSATNKDASMSII
jgi:hypothetical protein